MLISLAVTAKLICVFVFAYAKSQISHDQAHIQNNNILAGLALLLGLCLSGKPFSVSVAEWPPLGK